MSVGGSDYLCTMLFSDVVGHAAVKDRLIGSAKEGRVSHAQLFFGQPGSGVLPLAMAFAQFLNCETPEEHDSCGRCGACKRASALVHPDIHFVYPIVKGGGIKDPTSVDYVREWREAVLANPYLHINDWVDFISSGDAKNKQSLIPVDEAGKIIHKINLKAFEGKFKVLIIWLPEKMNLQCANALLKSLEEPPADTLFILASESREQLMATILSRTQMIKLGRLQETEIAEALMRNYGLSDAEAMSLAVLSGGNYTEAVEQASRTQGEGSQEEAFLNWMRLCLHPMKTMDKLLAWVDGMAGESKEQQKQFLLANLRLIRECLIMNLADGPLVKLDQKQRAVLQKFAVYVNSFSAGPFDKAMSEAVYHLERNASSKILFLDLSLRVSRILQLK